MRRRDNDSDGASEGLGPVGTFETLRDEGEHFVHVQQYVKAIESFTKVRMYNENNKAYRHRVFSYGVLLESFYDLIIST